MATYNVFQGKAYRQNADAQTMTRVARSCTGVVTQLETIPIPWGSSDLIQDATDSDLESAGYCLTPAEPDLDDTPTEEWNTDALLAAWAEINPFSDEEPGSPGNLARILADRLSGTVEPANRAFVIETSAGFWAIGSTIVEAADRLIRAGRSRAQIAHVWIVLNDRSQWVEGDGSIRCSAPGTIVPIGAVGSLGSIVAAGKAVG